MKKATNTNIASFDHLVFAVHADDRLMCYSYPLQGSPSWLHFEQYLREKFNYDQMKVTYKDEDGDDINLSSEEEFLEVLKVYQRTNAFINVKVTRVKADVPNERPMVDEEGFPPTMIERETMKSQSSSNDSMSSKAKHDAIVIETGTKAKVTMTEMVEDDSGIPPRWFTKYMETFKGDVTAESARKMMHRMQKFFMKEGFVFQQQMPASVGSGIQAQKRPVSPCNVSSSTGNNKVIHTGVKCDNCGQTIVGVRYKCGNCVKFDLCEGCESLPDIHDKYHVFVKILRSATYAGFKKKTGKMVPLLKHLLYDDTDKATDLRTDREKKLLKRLDKQANKLEKYREKHRQRKVVRDGRSYSAEVRSSHPPNGHTHNYVQQQHQHNYAQQQATLHRHKFRSASSSHDEGFEPRRPRGHNVCGIGKNKMDAKFMCDETIPDGSKIFIGTTFTKTWRLENSGMCPWTDDTVLKCLWETVGLRAPSADIPVPKLMPRENGTVSVEFTAPKTCGLYESHWCLFHEGYRFGHQIWCSIEVVDRYVELEGRSGNAMENVNGDVVADGVEVQEPENGEKERLKEKARNNMQHLRRSVEVDRWADKIKEVVNGTATLTLDKEVGEKTLRPQHGYMTVTPNNTPRDLTPPKSPEPGQRASQENLISKLTMALEDKDSASFLSDAESDIGGSLVSLSSTDSDLGYVVVPLPACFNFTVPAVAVNGAPNLEDMPNSKASEKEEISSVTTATDSDDETARMPVAKVFRAPDDLNDSDSDDDFSRGTLENGIVVQNGLCAGEGDANTVEAESGEDVVYNLKGLAATIPEVERGPSGKDVTLTSPVLQPEKKKEQVTVTNKRSSSSMNDRMVPILPEPIMSAAATVFNSARDILHTLTDTTVTRLSAPAPAPPELSLLQQLQDMGFCNRELNEQLLAKHNGDIPRVVTELLTINDNEWFKSRH